MDPDIATGISVPYGLRNKQQKALENTPQQSAVKTYEQGFFSDLSSSWRPKNFDHEQRRRQETEPQDIE